MAPSTPMLTDAAATAWYALTFDSIMRTNRGPIAIFTFDSLSIMLADGLSAAPFLT